MWLMSELSAKRIYAREARKQAHMMMYSEPDFIITTFFNVLLILKFIK